MESGPETERSEAMLGNSFLPTLMTSLNEISYISVVGQTSSSSGAFKCHLNVRLLMGHYSRRILTSPCLERLSAPLLVVSPRRHLDIEHFGLCSDRVCRAMVRELPLSCSSAKAIKWETVSNIDLGGHVGYC